MHESSVEGGNGKGHSTSQDSDGFTPLILLFGCCSQASSFEYLTLESQGLVLSRLDSQRVIDRERLGILPSDRMLSSRGKESSLAMM